MYQIHNFLSGQPLKASQLNEMDQGILDAQETSQNNFANITKGTNTGSAQQIANPDKVGIKVELGETVPHFDFSWHVLSEKTGQTRAVFGATGSNALSLCGRSSATNAYAVAMNSKTVAAGESSLATGYGTLAEGETSFAGGAGCYAQNASSVALGNNTVSLGKAAMSIGSATSAEKDTSFAGGNDSHARGESSFVFGQRASTDGVGAIAFGMDTTAEKDYAFAAGARAHAKNVAAAAFGIDVNAEGYCSAVLGQQVTAKESNQVVVGQYNDTSSMKEGFHSLFQVGCGNATTDINGLNVGEGGEIIVYWNGGYYSLTDILSIINNFITTVNATAGMGLQTFDAAKIK